MVIRRIGVASAASLFGVFNAFMGLIIGAFFALISVLGAGFIGEADPEMPPFFGALFGIGAVVILPIFYGILGVITGALGAAIYNLVAGMVGGLRLETQ